MNTAVHPTTRLTASRLHEVRVGATLVAAEPSVFRVEGPGAVDCLQGLLTCDVAKPGPGSVTYGAMLTPKGMIVVDFMVLRDTEGFTLVAESGGRTAALELLRKQLPPRLARVTDRTGEDGLTWLLGAGSEAAVRAARLPWPEESGRLDVLPGLGATLRLGRPPAKAPGMLLLLGPAAAIEPVAGRLSRAGARHGAPEELEAARILAGWPALGREMDERTLPQEVRFDELDGVSYTKGCYVGQETVARVHFRGHVNRMLRGLTWDGEAPDADEITDGARTLGRMTSALQVDGAGYALAMVRREVQPGSEVHVGERPCVVAELPFADPGEAA